MKVINLFKDAKITRVANSAAAGTTEVVSSVLDMTGYDSVAFIAILGDITATSVLTLTVKGNTANSASSPTPLAYTEGVATYTAAASDADNKLLGVDVNKPRERYVFASLTRTTANAVVDGIIAIQYNSWNVPLAAASQGLLAFASLNDPTGV